MDDESVTLIQNIEETKSDLSENLEKLEEQVAETVEVAADAISNVKESVANTVRGVGRILDVRSHVRNYPWASLGVSVAVGFVLGRWWSYEAPVVQLDPALEPAA